MNISEIILNNAVRIDFSEEINYGEDQAYIDYLVRFPTVSFCLVDTLEMCRLADAIRMEKGFLPFFPEPEECEQNHYYDNETFTEYCLDGYYNFYYGFNGFADNKMDSQICFIVTCDGMSDDEEEYYIDIDESAQSILREALETQLKAHGEKSIEELLQEAEERMEE